MSDSRPGGVHPSTGARGALSNVEGPGPPPSRRSHAALAWLVIAGVIWNAIYDLLMTRAVKETLLVAAKHETGRGPMVPVDLLMGYAIYEAVWKSTLGASLVLLAGLLTIRYVGRTP